MTPEERARDFLKNENGVLGSTYQVTAAFAQMLVAEEREACAKIAEGFPFDKIAMTRSTITASTAYSIAAAIRART